MSDERAIVVENVSKRFKLERGGGTLKRLIVEAIRHRRAPRDFWALRDVSFDVAHGETLGIIGVNGAGKSTLLALVAGTMMPTSGSVSRRGVVSSLLELGAGFHPDLTGRENVYLYGAILGLSRKHMKKRFSAIVDFAGIGDYIDQPVRHYSSGMYVRLAFAVATEVDPDILIIDEVLAVGDVAFQQKCMARMDEFRKQGKTMLIVSHDMHAVQKMSDRILMLNEGKVTGIGDPNAMISQYHKFTGKRAAGKHEKEWGTGEVKVTRVDFLNELGERIDHFESGDTLRMRIVYKADIVVENPVIGFGIADEDGRLIFGSNSQIDGFQIDKLVDQGFISVAIDNLHVLPGNYLFSFSIHSQDHRHNYHRLDNFFPLHCNGVRRHDGCCRFDTRWRTGEDTMQYFQ